MVDKMRGAAVRSLLFTILSVGGASGAAAAGAEVKAPLNPLLVPEVREAMASCASDVSKFCAAVRRGEGRIVRCLAANIGKIDPLCVAAMRKAKTALELQKGQ